MSEEKDSVVSAKSPAVKVLEASFVMSVVGGSKFPPDHLAEVAFAGRSNVGKSSLINLLLNRRGLAISSRTPGRTQCLNFFKVRFGFDESELWMHFVDLPGYGYAKAPKKLARSWEMLLGDYIQHRKQLMVIVLLVDVRRELGDEELWFRDNIETLGKSMLRVVLTKCDKLARMHVEKKRRQIAEEFGIEVDQVNCVAQTGGYKSEVALLCRQLIDLGIS